MARPGRFNRGDRARFARTRTAFSATKPNPANPPSFGAWRGEERRKGSWPHEEGMGCTQKDSSTSASVRTSTSRAYKGIIFCQAPGDSLLGRSAAETYSV